MNEFKEKRVFLIRQVKKLTATNALVIDNFKLPKVQELIANDDGHYQELLIDNRKYYMLYASERIINLCIETLAFINSYTDVTEQIVNGDYNKIVKNFDVERFYKEYETYYLANCPVDYARKKIIEFGDKSRYIDHKIMFMHNEEI
jgi:hypothetical protein